MKNLANCGPREFMRQTAKIRHAVEKWLTLTDIINIRKQLPDAPDLPKDMPAAEKAEKTAAWQKEVEKQARVNFGLILDAVMDKYPDETVDLLALCCFVEPENADNYPISDYFGAVVDMLEDENVMRFFTSLMRLARTLGLTG